MSRRKRRKGLELDDYVVERLSFERKPLYWAPRYVTSTAGGWPIGTVDIWRSALYFGR